MERFCGLLQSGLRSRRHPWGNLNKRNLHLAYLWQLSAKYNLENELKPVRYRDKTIQRNEQVYPDCECAHSLCQWPNAQNAVADEKYVMRSPYQAKYVVDKDTQMAIAAYLAVIFGCRRNQVLADLSQVMQWWGKMRIRDGGDLFRTVSSIRRSRVQEYRNNTCIRVSWSYVLMSLLSK